MKLGLGLKDITPRVGVQMAGFGPFLNRVSDRVRDRLQAHAALFDDNGSHFLLITCDLTGIPANIVAKIRAIICEAVPWLKPEEIMVESAHTHSAPRVAITEKDGGWGMADGPYVEIFPWKVAQAGIDACNAERIEGTLSQALVECRHIGLNRVYDRDAPPLSEVLQPDWEPAHPELTDTKCRVIRFDDKDGNIKAFWAYFGCHPVVCCQRTHALHGDYQGVAIHKIMAENPGAQGFFLQGAEGDVNSGCVHKPEPSSIVALDVFAERFASAIRRGLAEAKPVTATPIRIVSKTFDFKTQTTLTREKLMEMKEEYEKLLHNPRATDSDPKVRMSMVLLNGVRFMLENYDKLHDTPIQAELQCVRIGDMELFGCPFEVMQAIKNDVHAASKAPFPMLMSLCNGTYGYAPDNQQLNNKSYASYTVPLIVKQFPYSDIHNELVKYLTEMDAELFG